MICLLDHPKKRTFIPNILKGPLLLLQARTTTLPPDIHTCSMLNLFPTHVLPPNQDHKFSRTTVSNKTNKTQEETMRMLALMRGYRIISRGFAPVARSYHRARSLASGQVRDKSAQRRHSRRGSTNFRTSRPLIPGRLRKVRPRKNLTWNFRVLQKDPQDKE
eukprot:g30225.t1